MHRLIPFLILGFIISVTSCKTGQKALEKGHYDIAVKQAVNRLKSNDDSKKARGTLRHAYKLALSTHIDNANRAKSSSELYKWETVAREYTRINELYDEIRMCPVCLALVPNPVNYDNQLFSAKKIAADIRNDLGTKALKQKEVRQKALEAYRHFEIVKSLDLQYKDIDLNLAESRHYATLKVVVEPIPSTGRLTALKFEFFINKVNQYLHHQAINEFVRFYTPEEANDLDIDQIIEMEFDSFSLGNVIQNNTEKKITRDSVLIKTKNGQKIYETVKATLRLSEKSISATGLLDFRIINFQNGKVLVQQKMPSEYVWNIKWASYRGDERALSEDELTLINSSNFSVPSSQYMFERFSEPLYDQIISRIVSYYRNY